MTRAQERSGSERVAMDMREEERALRVLRCRGAMNAGDLGNALWTDGRPVAALLVRLEKRGMVVRFFDGPVVKWSINGSRRPYVERSR